MEERVGVESWVLGPGISEGSLLCVKMRCGGYLSVVDEMCAGVILVGMSLFVHRIGLLRLICVYCFD